MPPIHSITDAIFGMKVLHRRIILQGYEYGKVIYL